MNYPYKIKDIFNSPSLERLFDSGGIGFVLVAPDKSVLDANPTFCRKMGYNLNELHGMLVSDYTHPDDLLMTSNLFQHATDSNLVLVFEKRYITKAGAVMWCKLRSEPIYDENNQVQCRLVMMEDITREKLDEINLEQMAAITEASDDAIFRSDIDGIIQFWGKGAERMYGFTAEEAIGMPASIIAAVPDDPEIQNLTNRLINGEVVTDPNGMAKHKDGTLIDISALIFPIKNKEGIIVAFAAVHRNVSAFKQLEIQFQHSQRLETAGLLAGGIAHDFNNIITVIQGASNLLSQEVPAGSHFANHLNLIERSADRATRLTRQLLAFSRKQKITPVIINPNLLIEESVNILTRTLGDDIKLHMSLLATSCIREDATQLEQVLLNLAVNARYAMPQGGTLSVTTRNKEITAPVPMKQRNTNALHYVPVPIKAGAYVVLTVSDTGCGMDKKTLEHIFDPFFTTKPKGEGTGLGLSVVYGMVTQIGGGISVTTQEGLGTEFEIYLPQVSGEAPIQAAAKDIPRGMRSGRILVVEDDEGVRTLTAALLEDAGYTVFQAANPRVVLDGKVETDVDLILSDVMMPDINGPEFSEMWLQKHPDAKFLFMSGYFDNEVFANKMHDKILIQKPFKPAVLLEAVATALSRKS